MQRKNSPCNSETDLLNCFMAFTAIGLILCSGSLDLTNILGWTIMHHTEFHFSSPKLTIKHLVYYSKNSFSVYWYTLFVSREIYLNKSHYEVKHQTYPPHELDSSTPDNLPLRLMSCIFKIHSQLIDHKPHNLPTIFNTGMSLLYT